MIKKTLAVALGAMLMAGSAAAVEVNQGGKGDLLIAPLVMAKNGWESELKVINTDENLSTVAKVVFHAPGRSEEILDFLIFLSPGDVWTGTVVENADGSVGVSSTDASAITVQSNRDCPLAGGTTGFDPTKAKFTRPESMAYVNIFQARTHALAKEADGTVKKENILKAYAQACAGNAPIGLDDTINSLTGSVTMSNPVNGNKLTLGMTALANYNNQGYLTVGGLTSFATNVTNTTTAQVEDALWASNFVVPYDVAAGNLSFAAVTFPTKESYINSVNSQYAPFRPTVPVDAATVAAGLGWAVGGGYSIRDEEEHMLGCSFSPCIPLSFPRELNLIQFVAGPGVSNSNVAYTENFTKGWANVEIDPQVSGASYPRPGENTRSTPNYNNFGQQGAPALVTYIHWNMSGNNLQGTWQYAAKTYSPAAN